MPGTLPVTKDRISYINAPQNQFIWTRWPSLSAPEDSMAFTVAKIAGTQHNDLDSHPRDKASRLVSEK